jgi:hypothetical protein
MPESLLDASRRQFHPKEALEPDRISDVAAVMADAVALKFLDKPLTAPELEAFFPLAGLGK